VLDSTGVGDPIYDELRRDGLNVEGFRFTASSKEQLINNLSMLIEQGKLHYEDIPELINELEIFEYQITPSLALAAWGLHSLFSKPVFFTRSDKY